MANCGVCLKSIASKALKIKCEDCKGSFHGQCVRMSKADIDTLVTENMVWRCDPCASTRRRSMRLESQATTGGLTMEDVVKVLNEIRAEQAKVVADFNTAHEALQEQLVLNTEALKEQTTKAEDCMKKFEEVVLENIRLKKKVDMLEARLDESEQYSRRNTVEIHGIPCKAKETQEEIIEMVKKVGTGLGVEIKDTMIDACHRIPNRAQSSRPAGIIVKFVRRIDKDKLLEKRRLKRDFSTRHMNLDTDIPVYVNEALTPARRRLFAQAREAKKRSNYQYLWHRGGKIFMRKQNGDNVIVITCQNDLDKLE